MRWVVLTVLYLALTACKLVPADKHAELKDISSELDESGVSINVALRDDMRDDMAVKNCFSGPKPHKSLLFKEEGYNIAANLEKCKIIVTKTAQNGEKHSINGNMGMVKDAVQYFCPNEDLCSAAYDALGNFLEFIFLTSKHMSGSEIAKESKKQLEQLYNAPLIQLDAMPKDSGELIKNYPPRKGEDVPMQAYLIRIYSYLNAILPETDGMPDLDLHYRCDGCWQNVISKGKGDSYELQKVIKVVEVCVAFKHEGESVQVYFEKTLTPANTVSISEDTKEKQKVDKKVIMLSCHNSVPHLMLTCVGYSARYIHSCNNMSQAIGTMPIKREHIDKTVCAKLPEVYNRDGYEGSRKNIRAKAILKEFSYPDETVTFRTTTTSCRKDELSIGISVR